MGPSGRFCPGFWIRLKTARSRDPVLAEGRAVGLGRRPDPGPQDARHVSAVHRGRGWRSLGAFLDPRRCTRASLREPSHDTLPPNYTVNGFFGNRDKPLEGGIGSPAPAAAFAIVLPRERDPHESAYRDPHRRPAARPAVLPKGVRQHPPGLIGVVPLAADPRPPVHHDPDHAHCHDTAPSLGAAANVASPAHRWCVSRGSATSPTATALVRVPRIGLATSPTAHCTLRANLPYVLHPQPVDLATPSCDYERGPCPQREQRPESASSPTRASTTCLVGLRRSLVR